MGNKGIIYICTTSVEGLIKIGRTDNFNNRMSILEQNGYWNVSGLRRFYAVRVDDYIEKEKLIHTIFSKSQVANSELFALDKNLAKQMLDAFDGEVIYPEQTKVDIPVMADKQTLYTKDNRLKALTTDEVNVYNKFEAALLGLPGVQVKYNKYYVCFAINNKKFLSIKYKIGKRALIFEFILKPSELDDKNNICKIISNGSHDSYCAWVYNANVDYNYVWDLIMQCYNAKK